MLPGGIAGWPGAPGRSGGGGGKLKAALRSSLEWGRFGGLLADLEPEERPEAPEIPDWLIWIWRAWHRLTDERQYIVEGISAGMGGTLIRSRPAAIPWTAVRRWAEVHGYGPDRAEMLDQCIQAMDGEYLAWSAERAKL
ncbi:phage tail assembly chaperone [Teichococcus aestuarii]